MLSYSKLKKFLKCSQIVYWEDQGWRPIETVDELKLGIAFHKGIAEFFKQGIDPTGVAVKEIERLFGNTGWSQSYSEKMKVWLNIWQDDPIVLKLSAIDVELKLTWGHFTGVVDFHGYLDGKLVCIDWKTSGSRYDEAFYQTMDDQLTAYKFLLEVSGRKVDKMGFCVVNKKYLETQWVWVDRNEEQLSEYMQKIAWADRQIQAGEHHKLNDPWVCKSCDYLPLCMGKGSKGLKNVSGDEF